MKEALVVEGNTTTADWAEGCLLSAELTAELTDTQGRHRRKHSPPIPPVASESSSRPCTLCFAV